MIYAKKLIIRLFNIMIAVAGITISINAMNEGHKSLHDSKKSLIPYLKKSSSDVKKSNESSLKKSKKDNITKKTEEASKKSKRHSGKKNIPHKAEKELNVELCIQKDSSSIQSSPMRNSTSLTLSGAGLRPQKNSGSGNLIVTSESEEIDTYNPMALALVINNYLHDGKLTKVKEILKNPIYVDQIKNFKAYDQKSGDSDSVRSFNENISIAQQIIQQNEEQDSWDDLNHLNELLFSLGKNST